MYERLVRLYPRRIREAFGPEMIATFRQTVEHARSRGAGAVAVIWIREIGSLPAELIGAYHAERVSAALAAIIASVLASYLIANAGLFHEWTWMALLVGLFAGGFSFGAQSPRTALLVTSAALLGIVAVDRALLQPGQERAMVVPGVSYDVLPSPIALEKLSKSTPRVRTEIYRNGVITVVRTGGVDGLYILAALTLLGGGAAVGRRVVAR
jgi:hypothetical protein